ncbi:YpjP family protein [Ornithinibacillus halophilus]|uniref:YpjP-like protein n=1 Tax=Ornithinibacillus halophilus TaxID=930117 RepID=A0A1M5KCU2_9BACI|nr:YpjP family protein [Ornithinibacillus halophilus]SHG50602.1 YpjP-like protein [Ornithinibacillus halophilus]
MKLWMRKIAVALIAILTLGIYTPTYLIAEEENNEVISPKTNNSENDQISSPVLEDEFDSFLDEEQNYTDVITEQAIDYTYTKLGPRIVEKVEDEFTSIILPNIEQAIETILASVDQDKIIHYTITEQPTHGYGERIFNLYDNEAEEEIARFHVRRDNRPQEGYWFNFHYHLSEDNFETHHTIGEIYWDKNTPPKWMA